MNTWWEGVFQKMKKEKFSHKIDGWPEMTGFLWHATLKITELFSAIKNAKLKMKKKGITPFQKKVYDTLVLIPKGKVTTYKLLWNFIGCKSSQAIGQALTRNPYAPKVPCHRVIKTNGAIGGYAFWVSGKQRILAGEWVYFDTKNILINPDNLYSFI